MGLIPASLPHTLGYACTLYAPTSPLPKIRKSLSAPAFRKESDCDTMHFNSLNLGGHLVLRCMHYALNLHRPVKFVVGKPPKTRDFGALSSLAWKAGKVLSVPSIRDLQTGRQKRVSPICSGFFFNENKAEHSQTDRSKSEQSRKQGAQIGPKVPEGHHPRGTTLREALRGSLPLRGLCRGLSEGSAGSLRGFCGALQGSAGVRGIFRGFSGAVTLCLRASGTVGVGTKEPGEIGTNPLLPTPTWGLTFLCSGS